jgi:hypothetical protein
MDCKHGVFIPVVALYSGILDACSSLSEKQYRQIKKGLGIAKPLINRSFRTGFEKQKSPARPKKKAVVRENNRFELGSSTWARTRDLRINRAPLLVGSFQRILEV